MLTKKFPLFFLIIFILGCSGSEKKESKPPPLTDGTQKEDYRSQCEVKGDRIEKVYDLNRDKATDVREVYEKGVLVCREIDLNFDGRMDLFRYYDSKGIPKQEEIDLDKDGRIDIVTYFDNSGKEIRQEFDTNYDNKTDVWRYFSQGKIEKIVRDIDYNGKGDVWTICKEGKPVVMKLDINGDGVPEETREVTESKEENDISVNECSIGVRAEKSSSATPENKEKGEEEISQ